MHSLFSELDKRIEKCIPDCDKKIILWGYGHSGRFLEYWLSRRDKDIDVYIDNKEGFHLYNRYNGAVLRSYVLDELNAEDYILITAFGEDKEIKEFIRKHGYVENKNWFNIYSVVYNGLPIRLSYVNWLDYYYGTDIYISKKIDIKDHYDYSCGCDYAFMQVIDDLNLSRKSSIFDFGVGKGSTLALLFARGFENIAGVEYDADLCTSAKSNLKKIGCSQYLIINANAAELENELDAYDVFHMYNPFGGEIFGKVINNLEHSFERKRRKITLIYSGVTLHKAVIKNGIFQIKMKIYNDYWNGFTNICIAGERM